MNGVGPTRVEACRRRVVAYWIAAPWSLGLCFAVACAPADGDGASNGADGPAARREGQYTDPLSCSGCHPNHVQEWAMSPHAYAMVDPVLHAMVRLGQADTEGELDQFCTQCHAPVAVARGETPVYFDERTGRFQQRTEGLDAIASAGVSCDVCHTMVEVHATENGEFTMRADRVFRAGLRDPVPNSFHDSKFDVLQTQSKMCGSCHNVRRNGVALEETFREWVTSGFNGSRSCQFCHMPEYDGPAAVGGPERRLHRHTFVGVDVSLLPPEAFPGYDEMRELVRELLERSSDIEPSFDAEERRLGLRIWNHAGHALPSGAVADREMWVELVVRDASGAEVFVSGTLDARGDLRDDEPSHTLEPGSDPQLVVFRQAMWRDPAVDDPSSTAPPERVHFLWEPNRVDNHLIYPSNPVNPASIRVGYDLSSLAPGRYRASIRLRFRSFPPYLLRMLEEKADLDPDVRARLPIMEMTSAELDFSI